MPGGENVLWALKTPNLSKFCDFHGNSPNFHEISWISPFWAPKLHFHPPTSQTSIFLVEYQWFWTWLFTQKCNFHLKLVIYQNQVVFHEITINLVKIHDFHDFSDFKQKGVPRPLVFLREYWGFAHSAECLGIYEIHNVPLESRNLWIFMFLREIMFLLGNALQNCPYPPGCTKQ